MSANQHLRRAVELSQGGDHKSALTEVKRALEIEPDHPKGLIFRFTLEARLLRRAQRPGDAAVRYRAVLALDPTNSEALQMLRSYDQNGAATKDAQPTTAAGKPGLPKTPALAAPAAPATTAGAEPNAAKKPARAAPPVSPFGARAPSAVKPPTPPERAAVTTPAVPSERPTTPPESAAAVHELPTPRPAAPAAAAPKARALASDPPLVEIAPVARARAASTTSAKGPAAPKEAVASLSPAPAPPVAIPAFEAADVADEAPESLPPPSTETPLEPERRIAPRVAIEVHVGISSESNFFTGFSGDISEGGLFIATYHLLPIGSHVEVSFGVAGHEVKVDAVVCWVRDPIDINLMPGFGVRFGALTAADHVAIANFIEARAPMFYDDE